MSLSSPRSISTEDRISSLPDSLISHIFSFLPTKLTVTTSILSKRWTPLWKSTLTLYFDDESFTDFASFRHFMYSVFALRDATLPIRSLCIRCRRSNNYDPSDLNKFVQAAVQRGLEIFELEVVDAFLDVRGTLVPGLFRALSCKTLVILKLVNLEVFEVPDLVDLPLLKTLHLDGIEFTCNFVDFMNLVRGCPILEDLYTYYEVILPYFDDGFVGEFKGFPNLVRANIALSEENFLFPWLYNVKFLHARLTSEFFYRVPPTFYNLTHMELQLVFYYDDDDPQSLMWELVIQVLQHCPNLQNLTIDEDYDNIIYAGELPSGGEGWTEPEKIPECLSSQLRRISLQGFCGMECELQFAEYILLNSKLLCTMAVKSHRCLDGDEQLQMLVKLSSFPRGSVTCKLLFN